MSGNKRKKPFWMLSIVIAIVSLSGCNKAQITTNPEELIVSEESSSTMESAYESLYTDNMDNENYSSFFMPSPFDDSKPNEEYRLVSSSEAASPDGIYFIEYISVATIKIFVTISVPTTL